MTTLRMNLGERSYDITVGCGLLERASEYFNLARRVFIVTDDGVPREYAERIAAAASSAKIMTVPSGEGAKSIEVYSEVLSEMTDFGLTRTDCAVAVGGGVIGDLTGFAAASYMRGIDFYNVPTTLLSQVDSSIGGKCAINHAGVKNIVGAFHQPRGVIIDTNTLKTLPSRQISNGLAESVKMALTSDKELFRLFERVENPAEHLEDIILASLKIKKTVVEADEREVGLRKILNFGHTLGHGIEGASGMSEYLHGECVAMGMLPVSSPAVRERLIPILKKLSLPTVYCGDINAALSLVTHDKKCDGDKISVVLVSEVGSYSLEKIPTEKFKSLVKESFS